MLFSLYDAVLKEMDRLVAGLASYKWPSESQLLRARRVAIGILIIHSLHVSKAIAALLHVKLGNQTLILVRSQFEMAVKLSYIEKHPQKGGDFLLSDPFERYWLAKDYEIATDRFATIISDCKVVVKNNPGLVRYQRAAKRGRQSADFLAIREGLAFPSMREMILDLGWDLDLYVTVFLFGSLGAHGSINQLRQYVEGIDTPSPRFIVNEDQSGVPDYALQSINYLLGMIGAFAKWFGPSEELGITVAPLWEEHRFLAGTLFAEEANRVDQKRIRRRKKIEIPPRR